ncbi:MAG TPA: hypothetical protein HPP94_15435 [Desulfuromonadales bacterium]|nr:hypothetical protein [Desulfuromonadales bacterium]
MSTKNLWLISHKKDLNNGEVTRYIMRLLQKQGISTKQVASVLNIPTERVRNWYYWDTGMPALDLPRIMQKYDFVRQAVESSFLLEFREMSTAAKTSLPSVG